MQETTPLGSTLTLRLALRKVPGTLGRVTTAIGDAEGDIDALDLIETDRDRVLRAVAVVCRDDEHARRVVEAARAVDGVEILEVSDRIMERHRGGKIEVSPRFPLRTRDDLSIAYTPGVGRVCRAIADDPRLVWDFTGKGNSVAVLTDGSAVLGLGDIGPEAALPVMEGKAMLFKEMAGIDAYPICLRARGADALIGVSGPGLVRPEWVADMAKDAIVFALANPVPEIMPEAVPGNVRIVATGRSDYPNQINNVLAFPGVFRGLLDSRARSIDEDLKAAAARALAELVGDDDLSEEHIMPSAFDERVVPAVAQAVQQAAQRSGQAR